MTLIRLRVDLDTLALRARWQLNLPVRILLRGRSPLRPPVVSGIDDHDLDLHLVFLSLDPGGNPRQVVLRVPVDHLAVRPGMKGIARGKHGHGFEQVRLALSVFSRKQKKTRTQREIKVPVVAKII